MTTPLTKEDIGKEVILINEHDGLQAGSTGFIYSVGTDRTMCSIKNIVGSICEYCDDCDAYDCGCNLSIPFTSHSWTLPIRCIEFKQLSTKDIILLLI